MEENNLSKNFGRAAFRNDRRLRYDNIKEKENQ